MTLSVTVNPIVSPIPMGDILGPPYTSLVATIEATGEGTGDASGGGVNFNIALKPANKESPLFVAITDLRFRSDDATAAWIKVNAQTTQWKQYASLSNTIAIHTFALTGQNPNTIKAETTIRKPAYLGQPSYAGTGIILITVDTNVNTKVYEIHLTGVIFNRPLGPHELLRLAS